MSPKKRRSFVDLWRACCLDGALVKERVGRLDDQRSYLFCRANSDLSLRATSGRTAIDHQPFGLACVSERLGDEHGELRFREPRHCRGRNAREHLVIDHKTDRVAVLTKQLHGDVRGSRRERVSQSAYATVVLCAT